MEDAQNQIEALRAEVADAMERLHIPALQAEYKKLQTTSQAPDFWSDAAGAQEIMKQQSKLQTRIAPWETLQKEIADIAELAALQDASLQADLLGQLKKAEADFNKLKDELKYAGDYDDHDVFLSIHAGAGGTDAQDWAGMLLRMYVRWAEKNNYEAKIIEESAGEEAGIKSTTLALEGNFAYAKLKGEHGVHRLVRLSPFNADNLRQTSFAKVEVMPKISNPTEVALDEKDLKIDVYRSGGKGGQNVNKVETAVRLKHLPSGIIVECQQSRTQGENRDKALKMLKSRLYEEELRKREEMKNATNSTKKKIEWGSQIRSYVFHPYKMIKDHRTDYEVGNVQPVMDGELDGFIKAYLMNEKETTQ